MVLFILCYNGLSETVVIIIDIVIKETVRTDLENIQKLWNNGAVMAFVGFPEGLNISLTQLEQWLIWAIQKPRRCHYSIYHESQGYCGETFYHVDDKNGAALDIKLMPQAQGRGIASLALKFAINQAFHIGKADYVYVDPHPHNIKAWHLYEKLGFKTKKRPAYLNEGTTYLEIRAKEWNG